MSSLLMIPNFGLILEHHDLVSLSFSHRSCHDLCTLNSRVAYEPILVVADKQYIPQFNHITFGYVQALNLYDLLGSNLILLASCLNNSVNLFASFLSSVTSIAVAKSLTTSPFVLLWPTAFGNTISTDKTLNLIRANWQLSNCVIWP